MYTHCSYRRRKQHLLSALAGTKKYKHHWGAFRVGCGGGGHLLLLKVAIISPALPFEFWQA